MDLILNYITESTPRAVFFAFSFVFALYAWYYIYRSSDYVFLKVLGALIPLIPTIGPLLVLWIFNIPDKQHVSKRATMNHYGAGGKFFGFGSKRHTYSDVSDSDSS
ncbi:MAG: hypothetical protein GY951_16895 [Psychromonas sp.]|nr:hypothetical protein [Psychromonas sp.]